MDYCYKTRISTVLLIPMLLVSPVMPRAKVRPPIGRVPSSSSCPLKLVDLAVRVRHGDPVCCSFLQGLTEADAAACLCTSLKHLNLNLYVPISLQIILTCGNTPPPGYTCFLT